MPIHNSADVPRASESRKAISAEIPALPFKMRDKAARVTPRWSAAEVTETSPRYSRSTEPGCGGLYIITSMIVLIVDQDRVGSLKRESQPPVTTYIDRPMTGEIAVKLVKSPAGSVHIFGTNRIIKSKQLNTQLLSMLRLNARLRSGLKELLDTTVSEVLDHHE